VVLNTRSREQSAELSRLLRAAGFEVVEAPAIAIEPADMSLTRESIRGGSIDWVVLPSPNAGRGLVEDLRASPVRVVCGTSTAAALGLERVALSLARFSAMAALEALRPRAARGERVLIPRAEEGRDELVDGLRALGLIVEAPVAYRTVAVQDAAARLRQGGVDVVTLCSPSAAQSVATALTGQVVVCLGETTAATVRGLGHHVDGVAAQTSMASLVDAVQSVLGARV
jgi:uroporphyrinogen III methyltransferase/synthase